ncbi:plant intracellular Ras-group-related LRR protein 6-like [Tripterygium wilfordii]|uniref:Plant intracellular Ras-group-related LRR protein 6-like n=2 Tax=Tripterygium wilfordii TaxID=458696 RepID=A0A7J7DQL2_TRIWF|nr:plant intracellular Ras-group-related LRR protein 6-like [Tripterygium wilfordii]
MHPHIFISSLTIVTHRERKKTYIHTNTQLPSRVEKIKSCSSKMMFEQQMRIDMRNKEDKRSSSSSKGTTSIEEEGLEIVDLSGMSLDSLPNPSLNLATICKLDLSNNNLQSIPESLAARLLHVVVLDIRSNQLKKLPNSIGCLSKLKVLNVSGNFLRFLPKTIENCRSLEELTANFNQLTMLPDNIGFELTNLKKISVNSNKLVFLPRSLTHLTSLRVLDARLNNLRCLPEDLENLINLEVLNVSQNFQYLQSLPYSIGLLMSLVELDVSYNKITTLPDSMGCLKKLQKLNVEGNPLVSPPVEVVEQNLQAIKEYLSEKMNAGHKSPVHKKKSWVGKLVKYGTFNSRLSGSSREEREGFIMPEYRSIDGLASPRYMGVFSPRRLFSPRTYFMTR